MNDDDRAEIRKNLEQAHRIYGDGDDSVEKLLVKHVRQLLDQNERLQQLLDERSWP